MKGCLSFGTISVSRLPTSKGLGLLGKYINMKHGSDLISKENLHKWGAQFQPDHQVSGGGKVIKMFYKHIIMSCACRWNVNVNVL